MNDDLIQYLITRSSELLEVATAGDVSAKFEAEECAYLAERMLRRREIVQAYQEAA